MEYEALCRYAGAFTRGVPDSGRELVHELVSRRGAAVLDWPEPVQKVALRNLYIDGLRRAGRRPESPLREELRAAADDPARAAELALLCAELAGSRAGRLLLLAAAGYTRPELQAAAGLPRGTVATGIWRARAAARARWR